MFDVQIFSENRSYSKIDSTITSSIPLLSRRSSHHPGNIMIYTKVTVREKTSSSPLDSTIDLNI